MSDFLFAQPSFVSGLARVLDVGAVFTDYNNSRTTQLADSRAIYHDWRATGGDLFSAMTKIEEEKAVERVS